MTDCEAPPAVLTVTHARYVAEHPHAASTLLLAAAIGTLERQAAALEAQAATPRRRGNPQRRQEAQALRTASRFVTLAVWSREQLLTSTEAGEAARRQIALAIEDAPVLDELQWQLVAGLGPTFDGGVQELLDTVVSIQPATRPVDLTPVEHWRRRRRLALQLREFELTARELSRRLEGLEGRRDHARQYLAELEQEIAGHSTSRASVQVKAASLRALLDLGDTTLAALDVEALACPLTGFAPTRSWIA